MSVPNPPSRPAETGSVAWAVGLAVFAPLPLVGQLLAGPLMLWQGRAQRTKGRLAAENGRHAANLGLTYLLLTVVLLPSHYLLLYLMTREGSVGFFPLGIPFTLWVVASVMFGVLCIVGIVRSGRGKVFRAPAMPFLRP